jgi:hypothetical protein
VLQVVGERVSRVEPRRDALQGVAQDFQAGSADGLPGPRLSGNGLPNLQQRPAVRVPEAAPRKAGARLQVQVEAGTVDAGLARGPVREVGRYMRLVWALVLGEEPVLSFV